MSQFRPGDQVRLRSGGPAMTVVGTVASSGDVKCGWFDASQAFHQQQLPPGALILVEAVAAPAGKTEDDGSMGEILAESMKKQQAAARQKRRTTHK